MTANRVDGRQLRLTSLHFVRHALRSGAGIFFVIIVVYMGIGIGHSIVFPLEKLQAESDRLGQSLEDQENIIRGIHETPEIRTGVNRFLGSGGDIDLDSSDEERDRWQAADDWRAYLLIDNPAPWSAVVFLFVYAIPLFVVAGAFNQFSGDVQQKTLRYQLLRTNRANLFFGRFLGTAIFCCVVFVFALTVVFVFMCASLQLYEWRQLVPLFARGLVAVTFLTFPYVALCQFVSSFIDSPFGSLILCSAVVSAVPAVAVGFWFVESTEFMINLAYALPTGFHQYFMHPDSMTVALAALGSLVYTLVFLALGYLVFSRRDL